MRQEAKNYYNESCHSIVLSSYDPLAMLWVEQADKVSMWFRSPMTIFVRVTHELITKAEPTLSEGH